MKILTILGTRPEIIRLSRVIPTLDSVADQVVVHTGQNFDPELDAVFFDELGVRAPDHYLNARGSFGTQIATILAESERIMLDERPDRFLVLGDTTSSLAALMAKRLAIPVFHMEAGNRCYDDRVPEEVNRRVIDHSSDVLMPYTERSRQNLLREGIPGERIYVTGNPIYEVLRHYEDAIENSTALADLGLASGRYFLVTMHRAENVDDESRLRALTTALDQLQREYGIPVVVSTHPRTRSRIDARGAAFGAVGANAEVRFLKPFGFFDFITLERRALCVLSDSGTVQEECAIFRMPGVTLRDTTERPETVERGCNLLSGVEPDAVVRGVRTMLERRSQPDPPPEYVRDNVSETVANIVTGYHFERRR